MAASLNLLLRMVGSKLRPFHMRQYQFQIPLLMASLLAVQLLNPALFQLVVSTMADAWYGVSVFVAVTLAGFYAMDRYFRQGLSQLLAHHQNWQVPVAAILGALPGCGTAIIVVTRFVNGHMSFGSLVAVLISTMGDAAFLLLAREPQTALLVYAISLVAGIVTGYLVDACHGRDYLRHSSVSTDQCKHPIPPLPRGLVWAFMALLAPGSVIGLASAMQWDTAMWLTPWMNHAHAESLIEWMGFLGAVCCLLLWTSQPLDSWSSRFAQSGRSTCLNNSVVAETSFITVWVIVGFLAYELLAFYTGLDFHNLFASMGAYAVLLAIVIGFVPGCGPQILVTTLYLNGVIPFAALLANAISNDGDALFPALALTPKAAAKATLYSAIPAFVVGFGAWWWLAV